MVIAQEWWDEWWEEDWSWEGLARRDWWGWVVPVDGSGEDDGEPLPVDEAGENLKTRRATLQDYWKRTQSEAGLSDEDFLIRVEQEDWVGRELLQKHDGKVHFTLMHLPPKWRDGTETLKADPKNLPKALMALLKAELRREVQETIFKHGWQLSRADRRLQWNGIVLPDFSLATLSSQTRSEDNKIPIGVTAKGAAFSGNADFTGAAFSGDANFMSAAFSGDANFMSAAFFGNAYFDSAAFSGNANFMSAAFSGYAYFDSAAFSGNANFSSAAFSGDANFMSAAFSGNAYFGSAAFSGYAYFESAEILMGSFDDVRFERGLGLARAEVSESVGFDGTQFPRVHAIVRRAWGVALVLVSFALALFWLAMLPIDLWSLVPGILSVAFVGAALFWSVVGGELLTGSDDDLASEQIAMRELRKIGAKSLNFELESLAHATEMKYSRLRKGKTIGRMLVTKPLERVFSLSYETFSDYGRSILRPFLWVAILIVGMAYLYYIWAASISGFAMPDNGWWMALEFSWSNVFKPLSALSVSSDLQNFNPVSSALLNGTDANPTIDETGFWVRVVASLQSLTALVLVFLSGLAIRRRFQIN